MKRPAHLFEQIVERENLRVAFHRAQLGKRSRADVQRFGASLEDNLQEMLRLLQIDAFPLGRVTQFTVYDPKERVISAPCFPERVLHHAIMSVCEPYLERWLIADTFACRVGKGRIAALHRAQVFSRQQPTVLKLDMRRYFDSIPHARLLELLTRRFRDTRLLALLERVVRSHEKEPGRGLPIGSLTSQHLANFYLGWFDRFVKETQRVKGYVRYMDDCLLWGDNGDELRYLERECRQFLTGELELTAKPHAPTYQVRHGVEFLGCRVFPDHLKLNRRCRHRFQRRLFELEEAFLAGDLDEAELQSRSTSLVAFVTTAGVKSWQFRKRVLKMLPVSGQGARTG